MVRRKQKRETNIVQDDEGSVDTTDGVVAKPGRHPVGGWISGVAHGGFGGYAGQKQARGINAKVEAGSGGCLEGQEAGKWIGKLVVNARRWRSSSGCG